MKTWLTQTHLSNPHSSVKKSHPTPQNGERFLIVLIPLILSFLLVLGCAPTASTAASPPSEIQQVANLITLNPNNAGITASPDPADPEGTTLLIAGLTNGASTALTQTLSITQDPGVLTTDPDSIVVTAPRNISPHEPPTETLMVSFGTAAPVAYTLNIHISGAPVGDWFTEATAPGYITASFGGQTGSVTLDATTKILSVTGFTNVENGAAGSITTNSTFPMGFSATPITLPDPDGEMTGAAPIMPSRATLEISETGTTTNTVPYTLATITLADLSEFTPGAHITVTDDATPPAVVSSRSIAVEPATDPAENDKIIISGLTNAIGADKTYTLTVAHDTGIFTTPSGTDISLAITEPAGFSPGPGTLTPATTITITNLYTTDPSDDVIKTYNVEVKFSGADITEWFTATDIGNYFSGATFAGQAATLTLGADNVITIAAASGVLTNVPNGPLVLTRTLPIGFTLINNFTDPDDAENPVGAVDMGNAGTLIIEETKDATRRQPYDLRISLAAYTSPVMPADVTATFGSPPVSAASVTIEGDTITIRGFVNIADTPEMTGSVMFPRSGSGYTINPATLNIPNPEGTAATNTTIGTVIVTDSSGLPVIHIVVVSFTALFQLRITSTSLMTSPVTISSGATLTVMNNCEVLEPTRVEVVGAPQGSTYTALLPGYYDRNNTEHAPQSPATNFSVTEMIEIVDSATATETVIATFAVTVEFPPCTITDVSGTGADAENAFQIDTAPKLELVSDLVNNSNAIATANGNGNTYGNSFYELTANINLGLAQLPWSEMGSGSTGEGFPSIARGGSLAFTGTFDCKSMIISNLYINRTTFSTEGLFGTVIGPGEIKNCFLKDVKITGGDVVGSLVGRLNNGGKVIDSYATGSVSGTTAVGGLVGSLLNRGSAISNSYAEVTVTGTTDVGGLLGSQTGSGAAVDYSYATGNVTGAMNVGGLVGSTFTTDISHSYATGNVTGATNVGGLVGYNQSGRVLYSYATGDVTGTVRIGNFIGYNEGVDSMTRPPMPPMYIPVGTGVISSYWNSESTLTVGGTVVSDGKGVGSDSATVMTASLFSITTAQMQVAAPTMADETYYFWNPPGVDAIWNFTAGKYPRLIGVPCANRQYNTDPTAACVPIP